MMIPAKAVSHNAKKSFAGFTTSDQKETPSGFFQEAMSKNIEQTAATMTICRILLNLAGARITGMYNTQTCNHGGVSKSTTKMAVAKRQTNASRRLCRRLSCGAVMVKDRLFFRDPHKTAGDCPLFAESAEQNGNCPLLPGGFVRASYGRGRGPFGSVRLLDLILMAAAPGTAGEAPVRSWRTNIRNSPTDFVALPPIECDRMAR